MRRRRFLGCGAALPFAAAAGPPNPDTVFQAGYAEADITPKVDPGRIHDPCKVRAVVFQQGGKRVALVGVDAIGVARPIVLAARNGIQARRGIPPEAVLVGASHSHSAGPVGWARPELMDHPDALVRKWTLARRGDPDYVRHLEQQIVNAVAQADQNRVGARCGVGSGHQAGVSFNRRLRMRNGLSYTHPGQGNPDIVEFAGPVDPEVGVIGTWDTRGKRIGCIVHFACHATTNPPGISANWIYYLEKTIRQFTGPDTVVVFLQGCCGDVTQVDNLSPYQAPPSDDNARLIGGCVGAEVVKVLLKSTQGVLSPLDWRHTVFPIRFRKADPGRVARCREILLRDPQTVSPTDLFFAPVVVLQDALTKMRETEEIEVQAIQVGPAVFLSNPAELFCEFGLDLKRRSPFPKTFPVELANGSVGYVPTEEAFGPHGGGYETRYGVSRLDVTAGRQMVDAGLKLAADLKPGSLPQPPKARPFSPGSGGIGTQPWSYGNVPPQLS